MKKILKIAAFLISLILLILAGLILWLTITDYDPPETEDAEVSNNSRPFSSDSITILNWNLGYGGLGENMDFFMDGGTRVRAPEEEYDRYWDGIKSYLETTSSDFYFFQELDRKSTRSYKEDQYTTIAGILDKYSRSFAANYKVKFIPSPRLIGTQYGSVHSGLSIFSLYPIIRSERHSLPGNYKWPKKVFFLDRCLLLSSVKDESGREFVFINVHTSAYDKGGFLKREQLRFIGELAESEYRKGNYVIIGGDWNSYMPGTDGNSFEAEEAAPDFYQPLPEDWSLEQWAWGVDTQIPTNRSLAEVYNKGTTFTSVIDGYLVSPNLRIERVKTVDLGFRFSDHNPIELTLRIIP